MRAVTAAVAALFVCACTQWRTIPRAANGFYPQGRLSRAKIALVNGRTVKINEPQIRDDSVVGTNLASRGRAAFSVSEISRIDSQEYDRPRTLFLLSAVAGAFLGIDLYMVPHR
ncbi:MAG: hypothetical protein ACXU9O_15185 [Gemmatimonadaceae bacterium]